MVSNETLSGAQRGHSDGPVSLPEYGRKRRVAVAPTGKLGFKVMGAVVTPLVSKARLVTRIVGCANPAPLRRATQTLPGAPPSAQASPLPSGLTTGQSAGLPSVWPSDVTRWRSVPSGLDEKILVPRWYRLTSLPSNCGI